MNRIHDNIFRLLPLVVGALLVSLALVLLTIAAVAVVR